MGRKNARSVMGGVITDRGGPVMGGVITGQRMANYSAFRICMGLFPGWYKLSIGNGGCHYRSKMPDR